MDLCDDRCDLDQPPCLTYHSVTATEVHRARAGAAVQLAYGRHGGPPQPDCKHAAVLVLFVPSSDGPTDRWHLLLTKRPDHLRSHAGQICFPGGRMEPGETVVQAALREFQEELGTEPGPIQILGTLNPVYIYASGNLVTPVVAATSGVLDLSPDPNEVEDVLYLPWPLPDDGSAWSRRRMQRPVIRKGQQIDTLTVSYRALKWQGQPIWGATATMIAELANIGYQIL